MIKGLVFSSLLTTFCWHSLVKFCKPTYLDQKPNFKVWAIYYTFKEIFHFRILYVRLDFYLFKLDSVYEK